MPWWLSHFFGLDDLSGPWYGWWSGAGSIVIQPAIFAAAFVFYRHHTCHVHRCWRIGHRQVPGTDHVACRRHHPTKAPTHDELLAEHRAATTPAVGGKGD